MDERYIIAAVGLTVLLGVAYASALRVERRRQNVRQRLAAALGPGSSGSEPAASLRRAIAQGGRLGLSGILNGVLGRLDSAFTAAGGSIGLPALLMVGILAAAAVFSLTSLVMHLRPALVIILLAAAAVGAPTLLLRSEQSRFRRKFLDQFPDALDIIVRAVRAGLPVLEAMTIAAQQLPGPVGNELQRALDEMRIGVEMEEALHRMADRIRVPDFRFYAVSIALQRRTGGSLANTLSNLGGIIRRRKEIRLKAGALSAEARASVVVMAVLPFVVGGALYYFNPDLISVLFYDPRGRFMLGLAIMSLCTGIFTMVAIVKRSLR